MRSTSESSCAPSGTTPAWNEWSSSSTTSMSFKTKDLIAVGVEQTTARCLAASCSLFAMWGSSAAKRSKRNVYTGLRTTAAKRCRIVARENSSSACGTTCSTRFVPSPSSSASSGDTTVVLPPPMIICSQRDAPAFAAETNESTRRHCAWRSMRLCTNSNTSSRGSYVSSAPSAAAAQQARFAESCAAKAPARSATSARATLTVDGSRTNAVNAATSALHAKTHLASCAALDALKTHRAVSSRTTATPRGPRRGFKVDLSKSPRDETSSSTRASNDAEASAPPRRASDQTKPPTPAPPSSAAACACRAALRA
mmetsp:Transcript_32149/g.110600  ORF Transcript_32149/g.110600 Transcript_32149/m.110600 type:complete len:312 (+) Transcript_32149:1122-2057(+)